MPLNEVQSQYRHAASGLIKKVLPCVIKFPGRHVEEPVTSHRSGALRPPLHAETVSLFRVAGYLSALLLWLPAIK